MQNVKCVGAAVIEFRFFNRIPMKKKKKKKKNNTRFCENYIYMSHILLKVLVGVNFRGDLHLDVSRC